MSENLPTYVVFKNMLSSSTPDLPLHIRLVFPCRSLRYSMCSCFHVVISEPGCFTLDT
ncbi:hypothetical protein ISN45_Aa03g002990 [Arabidopsis thaliana x Arabidopsis arenosa]|uniref:Uncharacterized protein n=1 Tax=Arabidopsis thaliana x Arabidopsis arenosa TaxID=1240361 RepID=A0A8T2AP97_9BRAS|nr:hypothetical protein ISN45_Aa03g002990 [Arabidopsis thaliana x Arabidopsis arenosa]